MTRKLPPPAKFGSRRLVALLVSASAAAVSLWLLLSPEATAPLTPNRNEDPLHYLRSRPFDASAWLALTGASLARRAQPSAQDLEALAAAKRLAPNDPQVLRADAYAAFAAGNAAAGLDQTADITTLLPTESEQAYATLAAYADHPAWADFIVRRTAARWPGLNPLVLHACRSAMPLPGVVKLASQIFAKLPLSDASITCIGERAIAAGDMTTARGVWLNGSERLPRTIANVFNGDFEQPAAGRLFDWRIAVGGEYREGFIAAPRIDEPFARDNHVLAIRFTRRPIRSGIANQYLALEPGKYTLSYRVRGTTQPAAQYVWSLTCLPARPDNVVSRGAEVAEAGRDGWSLRRVELVVPAGCGGQNLELQITDKLQTLRGLLGELAFDDIGIMRH